MVRNDTPRGQVEPSRADVRLGRMEAHRIRFAVRIRRPCEYSRPDVPPAPLVLAAATGGRELRLELFVTP
jgi:hypothetical protein